jgi:hypothetical protein
MSAEIGRKPSQFQHATWALAISAHMSVPAKVDEEQVSVPKHKVSLQQDDTKQKSSRVPLNLIQPTISRSCLFPTRLSETRSSAGVRLKL